MYQFATYKHTDINKINFKYTLNLVKDFFLSHMYNIFYNHYVRNTPPPIQTKLNVIFGDKIVLVKRFFLQSCIV